MSETNYSFVPFDIETTGFCAGENDIITTIVFHNENRYDVFLNENENKDGIVEFDGVPETADINGIETVRAFESEKKMLSGVNSYVEETFGDNTVLTAFNGETYRGGFDLPFVRTRCLKNGVPWIFRGVEYIDSYEFFVDKNRFNTTITEAPDPDNLRKNEVANFIEDTGIDVNSSMAKYEMVGEIREIDGYETLLEDWYESTGREKDTTEAKSLDDIHEILIEEHITEDNWETDFPIEFEVVNGIDPFEESKEAVEAYDNGDFASVIEHCIADVSKTVNLTKVMSLYINVDKYVLNKI